MDYLDYRNSFLSGCPRIVIIRLQHFQNKSAILILGISKRDHISIHLASLHLVSIFTRIKYLQTCMHFLQLCVLLIILPTSLIFVRLAPLPVSFAHLLTALSSVAHLSYGQRSFAYSDPSTPNGTLFVRMSALPSMPVLSDPKLKLTFPSCLLTY